MKIIPGSRRRRHLPRVGAFLITAALIAGMVCCGPVQYNLTISSTLGGTVTTPGVGNFTYDEGTVVNLTAEPAEGYSFFNWSGNVNTIVDVNSPATTITMNGHYFITANFFQGQPIRTWYDLDDIRDDLGGSYILMNDLDSTTAGYEELANPTANGGKGWQPIGTQSYPFTGTFDGQGYEISDLFINRADEGGVGLFYGLYYGGVIKDVGVVNATVTGDDGVGGLMGLNVGTVSNSYSTGNVTGEGWYVGGLVGLNAGTVSNSYSTASASGSDHQVGGLIGGNSGTVDNSYSTGGVTGNWSVGGLVGANGGTVNNSFWDTETSGQSTSDGGTGKNTMEMQDITTFSGAGWDIVAVASADDRDTGYIWNIVNGVTYPFLNWQP